MAPRHTLFILACLPLASCAATQAETTTPLHPTSTELHAPDASTAPSSWQPTAAPQPVSRLGKTTSLAPSAPEKDAPQQVPDQPLAPTPTPAPPIQVETVTVHAPAPHPVQPPHQPKPKPKPEFPKPPRVPTYIPIPQEVEDGLDQLPKLPPLPKAEDIYIDVPF
ncbi:hypothetical protein [Corynebacterium sp. BF-R-2]|uniref:hypothetical protein n=1 Tax=Corynebacterium sp. BF-R-2 TaxID=2943494 RepID=UPI00211E7DC2|nr:hypothetical protein [Corynebacterium sp. BF-R-2]MCQ9675906.1 hypothetical protein [Corynebacterium sp. BF-R-2]